MTAEIAIFNRLAVALAADSAITIGDGGQKIYNSANKVFSLSKYHPIGVMVYGRAEIMDVPWETVIKTYRRQLLDKSFPKLTDQVEHFLQFLRTSKDLFPEEQQKRHFSFRIGTALQFIKQSIDAKVADTIKTAGKITDDGVQAIVNEKVLEHRKLVDGAADLASLPANFIATFQRNYKDTIEAAVDQTFEKLPLSAEARASLRDFCAVIEKKDLIDNSSGVVIAGFGEKEIFPACETHLVDSVVDGHLKYKRIEGQCGRIDFANNALIIPFAQSEMVQTFIRGIDPRFFGVISSYIKTFLEKYPDQVASVVTNEEERKKLVDSLKGQVEQITKSFSDEMGEYSRQVNWGPIINAVAVLSKDDLAAMAESLVNLTSFKRKVTMSERETVGGPIDVAVISKGDGFIWIKRKHYFQTELNQHFMRNYYRGVKE